MLVYACRDEVGAPERWAAVCEWYEFTTVGRLECPVCGGPMLVAEIGTTMSAANGEGVNLAGRRRRGHGTPRRRFARVLARRRGRG